MANPVLFSLQIADATFRIAARIEGPQGFRSSLGTDPRRGFGEMSDEAMASAELHLAAVRSISDPLACRVVATLMCTDGRKPVHTERTAAEHLGLKRTTLQRLLRRGLDAVHAFFDAHEQRVRDPHRERD